jgi:hypothetical protein
VRRHTRMNSVLAAAVSPLVAAWIGSRRRRYRRVGRPLSERERAALARHFSREFLDSIRVAQLDRIENPRVVRLAAALGLHPAMDLSTVRGMAFGDMVVLAHGCHGDGRCSVLFHELVHAAQYRALGMRGFLAAYVRSWLDTGRVYLNIELEEEAYALQERFNAGDVFDVEHEVRREIEKRKHKVQSTKHT